MAIRDESKMVYAVYKGPSPGLIMVDTSYIGTGRQAVFHYFSLEQDALSILAPKGETSIFILSEMD